MTDQRSGLPSFSQSFRFSIWVLGVVIASIAGCGSNRPFTGTSSVSQTTNPLVAKYTVQTRSAANVFIEFGPDTHYGYRTSTVTTPVDGSALDILVAGMRAKSTYHMRAVVQSLADGTTSVDADHAFTTGTFPTQILPGANVMGSGLCKPRKPPPDPP